MKRVLALLVILPMAASCDPVTTEPLTPDVPSQEIADADHGGIVEGFYFLPPMVKAPTTAGVFNPQVSPLVRICEVDTSADACLSTVAEYTLADGSDGTTISVSEADEQYQVNWKTRNFELETGATYRITVLQTTHENALELGHADVRLGANKSERKNMNSEELIGLVDNQTLPIKFRIEKSAGCLAGVDCGFGVVGPAGGTITTSNGAAGVSVPAGAVLTPITITIRQLDPATQPGGFCLPSGLRQDGACYDFDTIEEISTATGGSNTFLQDLTVGICPNPNAIREDRLTLHKYDPERPADGVVELPNVSEAFLDCSSLTGPGYAMAAPSLFGRLAGAARRVLSPVASTLLPANLHAGDTGRGGLIDSFSRITWGESIALSTAGVPGSAVPGQLIQVVVSATTAHNHASTPVAATDARIRFDYIGPDNSTGVAHATTDAQGQATFPWTLSQLDGVHTLIVSSRGADPSLPGSPIIEGPTAVDTLYVVVCDTALDCGIGTVDGAGGVITTGDLLAGVSVPAGAVLEPVTIIITEVDPSLQPGGRCLPTGIRQDGACYHFDTLEEISDVTGGSSTFLEPLTVAICPSPNAINPDRLTLHKYDPEQPALGVVELPNVSENFLDCGSGQITGSEPAGFMGRLAHAAGRALKPVAALVTPSMLYAGDTGRGGLIDSFSRISWAESLTLSASGLPATALPGAVLAGSVSGLTAHNHGHPAMAATDAQLRFEYTDPNNVVTTWNATTDAQGLAPLSWAFTQAVGTHTLVISSRDVDPSLQGSPVITDPTPLLTETVEVQAIAGNTVSGTIRYSSTPLPGVVVELIPDPITNPPFAITVTDANGVVIFPGVPDGLYHLKANGPTQDFIGWKATSLTVAGNAVAQDLYLPKKMTLLTPPSGANVYSETPALAWTANPEATSYTLQLNVTSPWTLVEQTTGIQGTSYTVQTPLTEGETYSWQVDAYDLAGHHVGTTNSAFQLTVTTTITLNADQVSDTTTGTTMNPGTPTGTLYQSFTPTAGALAAVRLRFRTDGLFPTQGTSSTINVRSGSPGGSILATATASVPGSTGAGNDVEVTHMLPYEVVVTPGQTYVVEWVAPQSPALSWYISGGNPYPGGTALNPSGTVMTGQDFIFTSYSP